MTDSNKIAELSKQVATLTRLVLLQSALLLIVFARVLFGESTALLALGAVLVIVAMWALAWMIKDSRTPMQAQSDAE